MDNNLNENAKEIGLEIARQFAARRRSMKMSQYRVAKETGVSLGSLKRFELTGEISLTSLTKLAIFMKEEENLRKIFWKEGLPND